MKRIFITTLLISLIGIFSITAQERIYTPALNLPANGAVDQMPDVVLDWDAVTGGNTGIIKYDIQLDTDPAFPNPLNFQTEFLSAYQTSLLSFGQIYYWHVRALDGNDVSGWSETWSFRVIRRVVLSSPNDASIQKTEIEFKWDSISGVSNYELQVDTAYYWKATNSGQSGILYGVAALDDTHAWIVGAGGTILFFDGTSWVEQESNISTDLYDLSFIDANSGWAVGKGGKITHFDGTAWAPQVNDSIRDLNGIDMLDANNGWTVGKNGILLHYDGSAWTSQYHASKDLTKVVAVDANHIWAVGKGGTILFNNGSGWVVEASGTTKDINAVAFTSADHGWAIGKSGLLLEYNTGSWKIYSNGQTYPDLFSLNFTGPDNAWAVGKTGTVLQYDGIEWYPATSGTSTTLNGVALAGTIGFMVGEAGTVLSYTGQAFNSPIVQTYTIPGTALSTTLVNFPFGEKFYWRMRASHQASTSEWSGANSFETQATVELNKPNTGSANQDLNVLLQWKKYSNLVTYDVEIDDDPAYSSPIFLATSDISINADQLKFGIQYYWRVRAINVNATSDWSVSWTFTTAANVTLLSPANGAVNVPLSPQLTWDSITGIVSYEVQLNNNNSFTTPIISSIVPATGNSFFVPVVLEKDVDYFWRVRAINGLDTSGWSNTWSFKTKPPVGIDDPSLGGKLSVYPNPAANTIYLQLNDKQNLAFELSITDLVGKTVLNQDIRLDTGNKTVIVDVSPLREGIYMLRMSDRDSVYTKKLIIKR